VPRAGALHRLQDEARRMEVLRLLVTANTTR
jgi:hypothetical protein